MGFLHCFPFDYSPRCDGSLLDVLHAAHQLLLPPGAQFLHFGVLRDALPNDALKLLHPLRGGDLLISTNLRDAVELLLRHAIHLLLLSGEAILAHEVTPPNDATAQLRDGRGLLIAFIVDSS